jgi:hypothetical protein
MHWRDILYPGKTRFESPAQRLGIKYRFPPGKTCPLQAFNGLALDRRGKREAKLTEVSDRRPRFPRPSKQGLADARRVAGGDGGKETLATCRHC